MTTFRRFLACLLLALASGWTAEILLGDLWLDGVPSIGQQLGELIMFSVFYGSGTLLIREITRRTGRGWPTVLCLGLAFGLIEEGLVDQTLFNPHYLGLDLLSYGHLGWLGTGAPWAIFVLSLHTVWSTTVPIIVVERLTATAEDPANVRPWIRHPALLAVPAVLYALGAAAIYAVSVPPSGYQITARQLVVTLAAIALVLVAAFAVFRRRRASTTARHRLVGIGVALVLGSALALLQNNAPAVLPAWLTVAAMLACVVVAVVLVERLRPDPFALAVGALATYAWVGVASSTQAGTRAVVEQLCIVAVSAAVVGVAARRRPGETPAAPARAAVGSRG